MIRRQAFTLIEMLVAITVGSALTGIGVFMLMTLLRGQNIAREHLEYRKTLNVLAKQFRDDIHASHKSAPINGETSFDLLPNSAEGTTIRYQCLPDRIDRTELQGDKIVRTESYMLLANLESNIDVQAQDDATIASIRIRPKIQTPKLKYPTPIRIDAVLGLDSQFSKVKIIKKEETEKTPTEKTPTDPSAEKPATEKPIEKPAVEKPSTEKPVEKSVDEPAMEEKT
jgi:prepilin-type N-terminal cleavage/methylation domain-containing protein